MSLFFELMGNNAQVATVSIRRMGLPREGFGLVFAYEITEGKRTVRGTLNHDVETDAEDLALVGAVLADYAAKTEHVVT